MGIFKKARPDAHRLFIGRDDLFEVVVIGDGVEYGVHVNGKVRERCSGATCVRCVEGVKKFNQTAVPVAVLRGEQGSELRTLDLSARDLDALYRLDAKLDLSTKVLRVSLGSSPDGKTRTVFEVARDFTPAEVAAIKALSDVIAIEQDPFA